MFDCIGTVFNLLMEDKNTTDLYSNGWLQKYNKNEFPGHVCGCRASSRRAGRLWQDGSAPPAPHRHATASHASRLASRYTGPRFQPGLSWPDKSRSARLLSAAAEARLSFQNRLQASIHLGCHVAMEKKQAAGIPA
ncbi:hypothetical protein Y032_0481g2265 [Ancylostoma ceylanicum]|uniref:Uncharacterized protein n=1 Tax=Ancylostoma ceylanicum TaxID=53326 RepID=A0A016WVT6_9BILA|nr:hypothetical protein Y032_0481g2265 [Ancylostoma ceylanicum]